MQKIILCFLVGYLLLPKANATLYVQPLRNQHTDDSALELSLDAFYYISKANYSALGEEQIPTGFESYNSFGMDATLLYGFTPRLTAFGRISWLRSELKHSSLGGNVFGLSDQALGANFLFFNPPSGFELSTQLQLEFPIYNNVDAQTNNHPAVGDQSTNTTLSVFGKLPFGVQKTSQFIATTGLGYVIRSGNFNSALSYIASLKYFQTSGINVSLGIFGMKSFQAQDTGNTNLCTLNVAGGSCFTASPTPSFTSLLAEGSYRVDDDLEFGLRLAQTLAGTHAPKGFWIAGQLTMRWPSDDKAEKSEQSYKKANHGFVNYSMQASVIRVNDRLNYIKINKGSEDEIEKGDIFDIFSVKEDGTILEAVARARVESVQRNEAALKIKEYFKEVWIEEGFIAKRPLQ